MNFTIRSPSSLQHFPPISKEDSLKEVVCKEIPCTDKTIIRTINLILRIHVATVEDLEVLVKEDTTIIWAAQEAKANSAVILMVWVLLAKWWVFHNSPRPNLPWEWHLFRLRILLSNNFITQLSSLFLQSNRIILI